MSLQLHGGGGRLRVRSRVVAVATMLGVLAGVGLAVISDRPVSASTDITVPVAASPGDSVADIESAERRRVHKYVELAKSDELAAAAAIRLGGTMTPEQVRDAVSVLWAPDTASFRITASNPDPFRAAAIADTLSMRVVVAGRADHLSTTAARIDERPQAPVIVLGSAGVAGGIGGFLAGILIVGWRHRRD